MRRTMFRAALTALLLAPVALVASGTAASAAGQTLTVTPTTNITDGQRMSVTVSGFTDIHQTVTICSADLLDHTDDRLAIYQYCSVASDTYVERYYTPGQPFTVEIVAHTLLQTISGSSQCGLAPNDCVVVDWDGPGWEFDYLATVPINFIPSPSLTVSPARGLPATAPVTVSGQHFEPGDIHLQECTTAWAGGTDGGPADEACGNVTDVVVAGDGTFSTDVVVTDPLTRRSGDPVPCGLGHCTLVALSSDGAVLARQALSFGVPTLTADRTDGLLDEQIVGLTLSGLDPDSPRTRSGSASHRAPMASSTADTRWRSSPAPTGPPTANSTSATVWPTRETTAHPSTAGSSCVLVAQQGSTRSAIGEPVPVTFGPRPALTLSPSAGLLDGAGMAFHAENLPPNQGFQLARCVGTTCTAPVAATSSVAGTIDTTVTASERVGTTALCHGQCTVRLQDDAAYDGLDANIGYTMVTGSVTATPSTGLVPGQDVVVAGTDLMPTYAGRTLFFPTGGWAVSICEKAAGPSPSLVELLVHCTVAPGGAKVDVPGSTSSTTVQVPGTITKSLGGTTDCTVAADACVIGLTRWEQDATLTSSFTPITFAGAP